MWLSGLFTTATDAITFFTLLSPIVNFFPREILMPPVRELSYCFGVVQGQWRIQDFPKEGAPTPQGGANIWFCQNFPKTAWNWKNLDRGGRASKILLCRSATEGYKVKQCYYFVVQLFKWLRYCNQKSTIEVTIKLESTVADPGFSGGGAKPLGLGRKLIIWEEFCWKLHEKIGNWTEKGTRIPDTPGSAWNSCDWIMLTQMERKFLVLILLPYLC